MLVSRIGCGTELTCTYSYFHGLHHLQAHALKLSLIADICCFVAVVSRGQSSLSQHTHHPSWYKIGFTRRQGDTGEAQREASSPNHIPSGIQLCELVCALYVACNFEDGT